MALPLPYGVGLVDPQLPLAWASPLNRGVVFEPSVVPNSGWVRGVKLRDLTRGAKLPSDGTFGGFTSSLIPTWKTGAVRFESDNTLSGVYRTNYVEFADADKLDLVTTFSIDFYANFDAFSGLSNCGTIVSKFNAGGQAGIRLEGGSSGTLLVTSGGSNAISVTGASAIIAGLHHHCLVSNGSGSTYYVDGKSVGTGGSLSTWFSNANVLRMGAPTGSFYGSGDFSAAFLLYGMRFANVAWTVAEVQAASQEWKTNNPNRWRWLLRGAWFPSTPTAAGGTDYPITASAGSFTLTGQTVNFFRALKIAAATTSFAETGATASLKFGHLVTSSAATFTNSGATVALPVTRKIVPAPGSFGFSGTDATLSASTKNLVVGSGAFVFTGTDVALALTRRLAVSAGVFTTTGQAVTLVKNQTLATASGAFTETGAAAGLLRGRVMPASGTSFQLVGYNTDLRGPADPLPSSGTNGLILKRAQQ